MVLFVTGKTAMTKSLCAYTGDRNIFADGILYVNACGIMTYNKFLLTMLELLFSGPPKVLESIQRCDPSFVGLICAMVTVAQYNTASATANRTYIKSLHPASSSNSSSGFSEFDVGAPTHRSTSTSSGYPIIDKVQTMELNERMWYKERFIIAVLHGLNLLVVLDHIDDMLQSSSEAISDFKLFLGKLLEQCPKVKLLTTSETRLGIRQDNGIVETCHELRSLTLLSTVRLYAKLSSCLSTSSARAAFILSFLPPRKHHVTFRARESTVCTDRILALFGNGDPSHVVKLACTSTHDIIEGLKVAGRAILDQDGGYMSPSTPTAYPTAITVGGERELSNTEHSSFSAPRPRKSSRPVSLQSQQQAQQQAQQQRDPGAILVTDETDT